MIRVFIDSCAVNRFATLNVDPTKALAGTDFAVAVTPDLADEYRQALAHRYVEPHIKTLLTRLLAAAVLDTSDLPDNAARRGTDVALLALAATNLVITLDRKPPWDRVQDRPGVLFWPDLEILLRADIPLRDALAARAVQAGLRR